MRATGLDAMGWWSAAPEARDPGAREPEETPCPTSP